MHHIKPKFDLNVALLALSVIALAVIFFGPFDITGFATAQGATTTTISAPANGASYKQGETFTVSATIGCQGAKCTTVKSTLSLSPGLALQTGTLSRSWSSILNGGSKTTTWLVLVKTVGNQQVSVSTTSKSATSSSNSISVLGYVPACYSNSDCGVSQYVSGPYCGSDGNVYRDFEAKTCLNPGTVSSICQSTLTNQLLSTCAASTPSGPRYCSGPDVYQNYLIGGCSGGACSNGTSQVLIESCPYGCSGGFCNSAPPPTNSCTDSDGGYAPSVIGSTSGTLNGTFYINTDYCVSSTLLIEYYCSGSNSYSFTTSCPTGVNGTQVYNGCQFGRCA